MVGESKLVLDLGFVISVVRYRIVAVVRDTLLVEGKAVDVVGVVEEDILVVDTLAVDMVVGIVVDIAVGSRIGGFVVGRGWVGIGLELVESSYEPSILD